MMHATRCDTMHLLFQAISSRRLFAAAAAAAVYDCAQD